MASTEFAPPGAEPASDVPVSALVRQTTASPWLPAAGLLIGALLLLICSFRLFAFVQDDAFITYRYAWNLRHGFGPVFNPGDHTEGYSCPLFMALTSLLMVLPGDVLLRSKLLGIGFALGTLWVAWRLVAELELPLWARAVFPVLLGASSSFALNAVDGMESSLQALLITVAALLFIREQKEGRGWWSVLPLVAAALNRPEAALYFAAALVVRALAARGRRFRRDDAFWFAAFCAPYAAFLLWRHAYYGDWLPNTVYAKHIPLQVALELNQGPAYLLRTIFPNLSQRAGLAAISAALWLGVLTGAVSDRVRRNRAVILPLLVAAQALVALRAGGDWMQGWRYMAPVFPLWTLLLLLGALEAGEAVRHGRARRAVGMAAVSGLLAVFAWSATLYLPHDGMISWARQGWATDARGLMRGLAMENTMRTADALNRSLPAGASVAFSEMGAAPFFTPKLRWLDAAGLTDREIGRMSSLARTRSGIASDYMDGSSEVGRVVLERRPDYVIAWLTDPRAAAPILDGAYVPAFRAPLRSTAPGHPTVLQVWRRRNEL